MRDFKFFQKGTLDDLQMLDETTRATASFNADTPEGYMNRRMLYHTNRDEYNRLNNPQNNNEMERYFYDRDLRPDITTINREEIIRRINGGGTGNQIKLYQATRVTTVNPKWWMKIKMFFQTISLYWDQIWGIIILATIVTVTFGLMIAKVLNIW